jgi:hypothetical protein
MHTLVSPAYLTPHTGVKTHLALADPFCMRVNYKWMHTASMTSEVSQIMYRVIDLSTADGSLQPVPLLLTPRFKSHSQNRGECPVQDYPQKLLWYGGCRK